MQSRTTLVDVLYQREESLYCVLTRLKCLALGHTQSEEVNHRTFQKLKIMLEVQNRKKEYNSTHICEREYTSYIDYDSKYRQTVNH